MTRQTGDETWWHHSYLDLAVFTLVMEGLNAGDIYIESGDVYSDYREKLISWEDYQVWLPKYSLHSSLSSDPEHFTHTLQESLKIAAIQADKQFPDNHQVRFENERLVLARPEAKQASAKLANIQRMLDERMPPLSILYLLIDTESWLDLHHLFGPASGAAGRLSDPRKRFIATLFCYGCNLGPSQTARSVRELSRKQIACSRPKT